MILIIIKVIGCCIQNILPMSTMAEAYPAHGPDDSSSSSNSGKKTEQSKTPTCILVLGMAGSGKTTFVQVHVRFDFLIIHYKYGTLAENYNVLINYCIDFI